MIVIQQGIPDNVQDALRHSDVADVQGADLTFGTALDTSTEVWTGYYKDDIACVMGLCGTSILSDRAYLWLLHTNIIHEHKFLFIRHSQMWIEEILKRYSEIWGVALCNNEAGIRWLRWLGAEFDYPQNGKARFTIRAKPNG